MAGIKAQEHITRMRILPLDNYVNEYKFKSPVRLITDQTSAVSLPSVGALLQIH